VPHKLTKSKVVPLGVSMKQTGTSTRGFEALGNWAVPGMGRLKAASATSGVKAADRAAARRNNLISTSSNVIFICSTMAYKLTTVLILKADRSFSQIIL
jgi:chorismate-pyruvate lyase